MNWKTVSPKPGDMIRVELSGIYHYGIFVSDDEVIQFGMPPNGRIPSGDEAKVLITDIDGFRCGNFPETAVMTSAEKRRARKPDEVVSCARSKLGTGGYNVLHNNCEHFANECVFGVHESSQIDKVRGIWQKTFPVYVYIIRLPEKYEEQPVSPVERAEEIRACSNDRVKLSKQTVWQLLTLAAERSFGLDIANTDVHKEKSGKWVCKDISFSLSHSEEYAACAVSRTPVGLDIEEYDEARSREAEYRKIACRDELKKYGKECGAKTFAMLWTAKESVFKREGAGAFSPAKINTLKESVKSCEPFEGLIMSVATNSGNIIVYSVGALSGGEYSINELRSEKENDYVLF